jgi:hypothetical protein
VGADEACAGGVCDEPLAWLRGVDEIDDVQAGVLG